MPDEAEFSPKRQERPLFGDRDAVISWRAVYWFNVVLFVLLSVSAFALAIIAILTQKTVNYQVKTLGAVEDTTLSANDCDTYFLLDTVGEHTTVHMPKPSSVTGCTFAFVFGSEQISGSDVTWVADDPAVIKGLSWDSAFTAIHPVNKSSVVMDMSTHNTLSVISDGSNYRILGLAVGVDDMV